MKVNSLFLQNFLFIFRRTRFSRLPGTHWVTICVIRRLALTVSDVFSRLVCFQSTSTFSALEVLHVMRYINLRLTYLLIHRVTLQKSFILKLKRLQSLLKFSASRARDKRECFVAESVRLSSAAFRRRPGRRAAATHQRDARLHFRRFLFSFCSAWPDGQLETKARWLEKWWSRWNVRRRRQCHFSPRLLRTNSSVAVTQCSIQHVIILAALPPELSSATAQTSVGG